MQAGASNKHSTRTKRLLSSVDLPPKMMKDITDDVELFFHKDSQIWYGQSGRPYRMGILAHGPPGTGKSSLVAGIASHINVPLVLINLQGMSDNDLREAFSRVPFKSVVALEDIDCVGADVGNRGAHAAASDPRSSTTSSDSAISPENPQALAVEAIMTQLMEKQRAANQKVLEKVLDQVKAIKAELMGDDDDYEPRHKSKKPSTDKNNPASNSVTLSGLLNVINGGGTEGRLDIMTTNHPEKLDPALYRAGRIERKFEISYASKASSIMTFKRLFDNDVCKRYTTEAIDRFARAFQAQFPTKSRITTAELAKYCGQYRGRPDVAVQEFADWLKIGADKFTCPVDYTKVVDEEGVYNVAKPFDPVLLQVSASDLVNPHAAVASGFEVVGPEPQPQRSPFWNPISALLSSGEYTDLESIQDSLYGFDSDDEHAIELSADPSELPQPTQGPTPNLAGLGAHFEMPQPAVDGRHAQTLEQCIGLGLVAPHSSSPSVQSEDSIPEFDDEYLNDVPESSPVPAVAASPASSEESFWDAAHHNQDSPVRSAASVKFSEPGKLALASPRPLADESDYSDEERHDSGADDSDTDEFDTAEE
jgi:hypothetical protein